MPASAGRQSRPRHAALDGEVDLERAGPVAEPAVGAGDATAAAGRRGCRRRSMATRRASARRSAAGRRPRSPARRSRSCLRGVRCLPQRVGDRLRPAFGHHPSLRRAHDTISISPTALVIGRSSREKAWAATPAHSARAGSVLPQPARHGGGQHRARRRSAPASADGAAPAAAGCEASANRSSNRSATAPNTCRHRVAIAAEPRRPSVERSVQHAGRSVVERVGAVDLGLQPREARPRQVEPGEKRRRRRRSDGPPSSGRASSPGTISSELRTPPPIVSLASEHGDVEPGAGQHAPRRRARWARCRRRDNLLGQALEDLRVLSVI